MQELSEAEAATVARFDAAPLPPEVAAAGERVEMLAEAFINAGFGGMQMDDLRRLAAAAIAALEPSPAEEAVKRVEALLIAVRGLDAGPDDLWDRLHVSIGQVRAALASPAPAPQDGVDWWTLPDAEPVGPLTGGLITPENPVGGLRPASALQGEEGHAAEVCRCGLPRATAVHGNPFGAGHAYEAAR